MTDPTTPADDAADPTTGETSAPATAEAPPGASSPAEPSPDDGADVGRRRFFRQFAGELFQGAATVVGAAQVLQRASAEAAGAILDPSSMAGTGTSATPARPPAPTGFRTPFREENGILYIVDQRKLPDELVEYPAAVCRAGGPRRSAT